MIHRTKNGVDIKVFYADGLTTVEWFEVLGIGDRNLTKTTSFKVILRKPEFPSIVCVWQGRVTKKDLARATQKYYKLEEGR